MTTVLVLDDHELFGAALVRLLARAGYETVHCLTVRATVAVLEQSAVHLVLVDVNLGHGLNGCVVAADIARRWPHLRTAVMSGYGQTDYPRECPQALPFIEKPFQSDTFIARLQAILAAAPYAPGPELSP